MPTEVIANEGDCLCVIAMQNGFLNCRQLRGEPRNRALLNRPLEKGDVVTVPDYELKHVDRATELTHKFVKQIAPPVSLRYVRDSGDTPYRNDADLLFLNVSNFPTEKGGAFANTDFPAGFGFNPDGHADPDAFKVEVVDPAAGAGPIRVDLDVLIPSYNLVNGRLAVSGHQPQTITVHHKQQIRQTWFMDCAGDSGIGAFRSKYLRLVTHDEDVGSGPPGQTILVVSLADGKGTGEAQDPDNIEILDLALRASYTIARCTAPSKCKLSVSKPLGDESEKRRFRIAFHLFTKRNTGATVGGLTSWKVRRNALYNLRGFYAQACMAPRLVSADGSQNGSPIVFVPEPDNNMITIGEPSGLGASTQNEHGKASVLIISDASRGVIAQITFVLQPDIPDTGDGDDNSDDDDDLDDPPDKMKPYEIASAIKDTLDKAIFKVDFLKNPKPSPGAAHNSYDVFISGIDGVPLDLSVRTDDTILRNNITVPRVNIDSFAVSPLNRRRLFRSSPGAAGAMNVYAVAAILDDGSDPYGGRTLAFSYGLSFRTNIDGTQARSVADSIVSEAQWLKDGTSLPGVLPHECGHILGEVGHVDEHDPHYRTEMMTPYASAPSDDSPNPTRISDFPVLVNYELDGDRTRLTNAVNRFTTSRPDLLEKW